MKTPLLIFITIISLLVANHAQAPAAKPGAAAPKLTARDIRGLPFCREFKEQIFKASDRDIGDELRVSSAVGLRISGKKRADSTRYNGRPVGHMGKVALMPPGDRSGKLTVKVPSSDDVTYYFAVIETAAGTLDTKVMELKLGKNYTWSLKTTDGQKAFVVLDGATEVATLSGPEKDVKGFGFAATVRYKGNEADLLATFD